MVVDKSKQTGVIYMNVDVELHCSCGQYIQNCEELNVRTCPNCGQKWLVIVTATEINDRDLEGY